MDLGRYSENLNSLNSLIVKSFLNNNYLYVYDENEFYDDILKNNEIKTALIFPVSSLKNKFGVLVIGFKEKRKFVEEELKLLNIISKEVSLVVNIFELYNKASKDTINLINLNRVKDEFLTTVNHEIKTPLTTIKGFVSLLLNGEAGSLNDEQIAFLNIVEQSTNRLINIVTNILDISKINSEDSFEFEKLNIGEVVENVFVQMKIKAYSKGIAMKFDKGPKDLYVRADKHWLSQAITNLVDNAIKYSPSGSDVILRLYDRGKIVVFMVEDKGFGIDEEDKKYIFEKFYRAKNTMMNVEGSGLGLSIAKDIIEKHNGKIWFESEKGKGSKFYFAIPKFE